MVEFTPALEFTFSSQLSFYNILNMYIKMFIKKNLFLQALNKLMGNQTNVSYLKGNDLMLQF